MDVKEVLLPGVGLRYEFVSHKGDRIGIIARRGGDFDLVLYGPDDPDRARPVLRLTDEEAEAVAQILGAPRIAERFTELTREVPGLEAGQIHIRPEARSWTGRWGAPALGPGPGRRSSRSCATTTCSPRRARPKCCAPTSLDCDRHCGRHRRGRADRRQGLSRWRFRGRCSSSSAPSSPRLRCWGPLRAGMRCPRYRFT